MVLVVLSVGGVGGVGNGDGDGAAAWSGYLSLPPRLYCPLHKRCNPALTRLDPTAAVQVKRYDGNVEDLGLTFCVDDDFFGSKVHHNLLPGGSDIPVTNDNRCVSCRGRKGYKRFASRPLCLLLLLLTAVGCRGRFTCGLHLSLHAQGRDSFFLSFLPAAA